MLWAPVFSFVVSLTLAVGIGANVAIFSTIYAVLLKPLPFPSGERLVWLGESNGNTIGVSVTWLNFEHWRKENHTFERMAAFEQSDPTFTGRGPAVLTHAGMVTSAFFELTGSRPMMGRLFEAADEDPHSRLTVVLSPDFWEQRLGADPDIVGKSIRLDGDSVTVIGVLSRDPGFWLRHVDFYLPLRPSPAQLSQRDLHGAIRALALLKPGVTLARARSDLDAILQRLAKADPGPEDNFRAYAEFLTKERTGDVKRQLVLLMGSVCLILLLACANIGGLLLIRSTTRAREIAIRTAIGAGRSRLARQLVTETLLLCFLGGAFGIFLAGLSLRAMETFGPRGIPRLSEASLNLPVLLFASVLNLAVGLACAVAPVLGSRKVSFSVLLKEGSSGSGNSAMGHMLRGGLVIAEIALPYSCSSWPEFCCEVSGPPKTSAPASIQITCLRSNCNCHLPGITVTDSFPVSIRASRRRCARSRDSSQWARSIALPRVAIAETGGIRFRRSPSPPATTSP